MNKELRESNTELRENNNFLRNKSEVNVPSMSFSSIVSGKKIQTKTVQLIVQPKNNYNGDILETVQKEMFKQKKAKIIKIKKNQAKQSNS